MGGRIRKVAEKAMGSPNRYASGAAAYRRTVLPLICLDVDGTLVRRAGVPSGALWAAAADARIRGQRLTLCTARLAAGPTREWAERLDPSGWHVFHTGAARWNPGSGEVRTTPLSADAQASCHATAGATGWVVETYSWDDYVVDSDDPLAVAHAGLLALPHRRRTVDELESEVVRVQFVVHEADAAAAVASAPAGTTASAATSPSCRARCSSRSPTTRCRRRRAWARWPTTSASCCRT